MATELRELEQFLLELVKAGGPIAIWVGLGFIVGKYVAPLVLWGVLAKTLVRVVQIMSDTAIKIAETKRAEREQ